MDLIIRTAADNQNSTSPAESENPFKLYHYHPTEVGAVIFILLFLATTIWHFWQIVRSRCWFIFPLAIGGILQIVGYGGRFVSGRETPDWTLTPYILQAILLLVAPALYAATIYMELGRIVTLIDGEGHTLISRPWMTKTFVIGDVLSFFLQGGGGGYQASGTLEALDLGSKIIIVGLFVQLVFFGLFLIVAINFHIRIRRSPTGRSSSGIPWEKQMKLLYATGFLIMVRSIFRAVEYLEGFDGYLLSHEVYLYIFDASLMVVVMVLFNIYHPVQIFSRHTKFMLFDSPVDLPTRN